MNIFQIKNESRSKVTNANGKTESLHVRNLLVMQDGSKKQ